MSNKLCLNVHGVTATIVSDDQNFLEFVRSNYLCFVSELVAPPNIKVWFSPERGEYARERKHCLTRLGEGLHRGEESLYWENEFGFSSFVEFIDPQHWSLSGYHFDLLTEWGSEERLKNYMRSMRWMIHFPVFLMLEQHQGKRLVHAAAVSKEGKGIVLAGLNKVGKSSIARYLYEHRGYNFLADNFLLTDGEWIYPFPEKCRLSAESLSHLSFPGSQEPVIYGKHHVPIELGRIDHQAKPEIVCIVGNSQQRGLERISQRQALSLLESLHRYVKEFPEYTFYSLIDSYDFWDRTYRPLFSDEPVFLQLSQPMDWSIEETVGQLIGCTSTT